MCTTASKNAIVNTAMSESSGFLWIWMSLARLPIGADPGVSCKSSPDEPSQCAIVRQVLVVSKWYYVRSSRILVQQRMKVQWSAQNAKFWWNVIDLKQMLFDIQSISSIFCLFNRFLLFKYFPTTWTWRSSMSNFPTISTHNHLCFSSLSDFHDHHSHFSIHSVLITSLHPNTSCPRNLYHRVRNIICTGAVIHCTILPDFLANVEFLYLLGHLSPVKWHIYLAWAMEDWRHITAVAREQVLHVLWSSTCE